MDQEQEKTQAAGEGEKQEAKDAERREAETQAAE